MAAFAQKVPFKYHCLDVDKKLIDNLGLPWGLVRRAKLGCTK